MKIIVYDNSGWGLVHIEMEAAGLPATKGASFPNMDFAAYAKACGAQGFAVDDPAQLETRMRAFLDCPGPALLHAKVSAAELPAMPHIDPAQAIRFGIAKVKERMLGLVGQR